MGGESRGWWVVVGVACGVSSLTCGDDESAGPGAGGSASASIAPSSAVSSGTGGAAPLPPVFTVQGMVIDEDGAPVAGAFVLQGGRSHEPPLTSAADGTYSIELYYDGLGTPAVVATKSGYRTGGVEFYELPTAPVEIILYGVGPPDNIGYTFGEPGTSEDPDTTAYCRHCHGEFAAEFQTSKHAGAAKNIHTHDLYAGVSRAHANQASCQAAGGSWKSGRIPGTASSATFKCYLGGGVLPDLNLTCGEPLEPACDDPAIPMAQAPTAFGACADCHAPAIDGAPGGRGLLDAVGIPYDNGVHCDLCHKIRDVDLAQPAGVAGRLILQRPSETIDGTNPPRLRLVMFGPLLDVPNYIMGGSYQPKFSTAEFCAGCHLLNQPALVPGDSLDAMRWPNGLPVHSTYDEWLAGPYPAWGLPCQRCHMPPHVDRFNTEDHATADNASITFGFARPPDQIRQHRFPGPLSGAAHALDRRLLDTALNPKVTLSSDPTTLSVAVTLLNVGCGHAVPTGEPMRALVVVLDARCDGAPLAPVGGLTIPDVGGARARALVGSTAVVNGTQWTWNAAAGVANVGDVIRVVRPTGGFYDYTGVGFFANPMLTPADKGMPVHAPVGFAQITQVAGAILTVDQSIAVLPGDIAYLGDPIGTITDGQASIAVAGAAGWSFSRVLVDSSGNRNVPHHRAVDIASDNRIPPGASMSTNHVFAHPGACTNATVTVTVLYRPLPLSIAEPRGWSAKDWIAVVESASTSI